MLHAPESILSTSLDVEVQNAVNALKKERRRLRKLEKLGRHFKPLRGSQSASQRRTPNKSRSPSVPSLVSRPSPKPFFSPSMPPLSPSIITGSVRDNPIDLTTPASVATSIVCQSPSLVQRLSFEGVQLDNSATSCSPTHDRVDITHSMSPSSLNPSRPGKRKRPSRSKHSFTLTNSFSFSLAPSFVVFARGIQSPKPRDAAAPTSTISPTVTPIPSASNSQLSPIPARTLLAAWSSVHLELWRYDHVNRTPSRLFLLSCGSAKPYNGERASHAQPCSGVVRYKRVDFGWKDSSLLVALSEFETAPTSATSGTLSLKLQIVDLLGRTLGTVGTPCANVSALCPMSRRQWIVALVNGHVNFYSLGNGAWTLKHCMSKFAEPAVAISRLPSQRGEVRDMSRALIMFPSLCVLCSAFGEILEQFPVTGEQLSCHNLSVRGAYPTVLLSSRMCNPTSEVNSQSKSTVRETIRRSLRTSAVRALGTGDSQLKLATANSVEAKTLENSADVPVIDSYVVRALQLGPTPSYHFMSLPIKPTPSASAVTNLPSVFPCFASPIVCTATVASSHALGSCSRVSSFSRTPTGPSWHYAACALLKGDVYVWSARTGQLVVFMDPCAQANSGANSSANCSKIGDWPVDDRNKVVSLGFIPYLPILCVCTADGAVRVFS